MNKCAKFYGVQAVKKLNSISRAQLNVRRRPVLCTTLYKNSVDDFQVLITMGNTLAVFVWYRGQKNTCYVASALREYRCWSFQFTFFALKPTLSFDYWLEIFKFESSSLLSPQIK